MLARWPAAALAVLALLVSGCGSGDTDESTSGSKTLTVYSSMPLQGDDREQSRDIVNGIKLALQDAGGRVGELKVNYVSLDDADPETGRWDADRVLDNARKATEDRNAIAYIGEFDSGATALSLPLLNEAGVLQVSPSNTYVGLTRDGSGGRGEPQRFYPSGRRTYVRVVPPDNVQAAAQLGAMAEDGVRSIYLLRDEGLYGRGLTEQVRAAAEERGLELVGDRRVQGAARDFSGLAQRVAASGADAVFYGTATPDSAARAFRALHRADPALRLYGGDALATSTFAELVGSRAGRRVLLTSPALDPRSYPPRARRFFTRFREEFGKAPEPYAIFGYESMALVLDAIRRAGPRGNDRNAVVDALFTVRDRESVLGTYSIDGFGDTTRREFGSLRVRDGELVHDRVLRTPR
jgi:branched-chain amino acid transport system substrate-binding protein